MLHVNATTFVPAEPVTLSKAQTGASLWLPDAPQKNTARGRAIFSSSVAFLDLAIVALAALATGHVYHYIQFKEYGVSEIWLQMAGMIGLFVLAQKMLRGAYSFTSFLDQKAQSGSLFQIWNFAFMAAIMVGFLTKTSEIFSRATVLIFYVTGFLGLLFASVLVKRVVRIGSKTGSLPARRVFLIGSEKLINRFVKTYQPWNLGFEIVGAAALRVPSLRRNSTESELTDEFSGDLERSVLAARKQAPDDVFVLLPWTRRDVIEATVDAYLNIPASIHLGPEQIMASYEDLRVSRFGTLSTLNLVRRPLTFVEVLEKRIFDIVLASVALVALTPLFLIIGILIKWDSRGPVFFRQQRYGFNQRPFRILKFRTMTTMEDGADFVQARKNDARITKIGKTLRRLNIDELPQLVNVLLGHMSLVGPRPHALAHNHEFERKIAFYARRHNVRPGITGWAQVNGWRGDTSTDEKMAARLSHDLYYIDNWSLWLDLKIIILTVLSPKAYRNAH